MEKPNEIH